MGGLCGGHVAVGLTGQYGCTHAPLFLTQHTQTYNHILPQPKQQRALAEPQRTARLCRLRARAEERLLVAHRLQSHHHHNTSIAAPAPVTAAGDVDRDREGTPPVVAPSLGGKQQEQEQEQQRWGLVAAVAAGVVAAGSGEGEGEEEGPLLSDDMFRELMEFMCPPWDPMRGARGEGDGGGGDSGCGRLVLPAALAGGGGGDGGGVGGWCSFP